MRLLEKGWGELVIGWIGKLCNMAFESCLVPEDCRSAVTAHLYKGKRERTECKNYKGISLLIVAGKLFAGIVVDRK